jgi:hypothetical protein
MDNQLTTTFEKTIVKMDDFIFIEPICNYFGIAYRAQLRVINKDHILKSSSTKKCSKMLFGDNKQRIALNKRGFIRWIQLINTKTVHEKLRSKLEQYQIFIFDFLFGNLEKKEANSNTYNRLNKLKKLKRKINLHIKECETKLKYYVDGHLGQGTLFEQKIISE